METSPILSSINKIRDDNRFRSPNVQDTSILHNHQCDCDDVDRKIYISAEIHPDCLDHGYDLDEVAYYHVGHYGVFPDDVAAQIIDKRLGGPGNLSNVIPLNQKIDLSAWKDNETVIYEHVKQGGNRHALMLFALDYNDEMKNEIGRPSKIYFHFVLYEMGETVGEPMEGVIVNWSVNWK